MAGAVIILSGWLSFGGGSTLGSLAYAYLPERFGRNYAAIPNKTLATVLTSLVVINHIRAHMHAKAFYDAGERDIGGFPYPMYVQNLALIGYAISICLADAFFRYFDNSSSVSEIPMIQSPPPETTTTSRSLCSLYAGLLCVLPVPISWPLAILYIIPISI